MKILNFFNPFAVSDKQLYGKTLLIFCFTVCGGIFALTGDFDSSKSITPGFFCLTVLYAQLEHSSRQKKKTSKQNFSH